jgi:hypothetical protein
MERCYQSAARHGNRQFFLASAALANTDSLERAQAQQSCRPMPRDYLSKVAGLLH